MEATGKHIEVMVYGDGAFKDPVGKIWELADPVVSPAYTPGLEGTPNELKLKYLADNDFADLSGDALKEAIKEQKKELFNSGNITHERSREYASHIIEGVVKINGKVFDKKVGEINS